MSRRNVLLGLGTLIAGGGAVLGTGAFTTVEAQRTVSVETAGDASAFLQLTPGENSEYIDDSGDTIQINLDGGSDADGSGINQDARSRFEDLVDVTNQGTENVESLTFDFDFPDVGNASDYENAFKITAGDETLSADGSQNFLGTGDVTGTLGTGDTVTFGIEVDLLSDNTPDTIDQSTSINLTITADSDSS